MPQRERFCASEMSKPRLALSVRVAAWLVLLAASGGCTSTAQLPLEVAGATAAATPRPAPSAASRASARIPTLVPLASPTRLAASTAGATAVPSPSILSTRTPDETVRLFYRFLAEERYAELRNLLVGPAYTNIPDAVLLSQRAPGGMLTVDRAEVTEQEASGNHAVVVVTVSERMGADLRDTRQYVGTWKLVRGPAGWLLAEPNLELE